jgi:hypothetical protein
MGKYILSQIDDPFHSDRVFPDKTKHWRICYSIGNRPFPIRRRALRPLWKVHIMSFRSFSETQAKSVNTAPAKPLAGAPDEQTPLSQPDKSQAENAPAPKQGAND